MQTTEQGAQVLYPIQFIQQEALGRLAVPLVRVSLCGMIKLEVLLEVVSPDPPLGRYEVIAPHTLRGRGAVPSLMLLKLLGSQPHRFATKDWLTTQMQQEMESGALVRLDTIASQLRTLLGGVERVQTSAVRLRLVEYLRNGRSSGPGYQLGQYPLLWLDTEALAFHVEQAARMERFGDDALPFWERAYALASRGEYLSDEPYSEWVADKRAEVQGSLRQSVHALQRLYLGQHGATGVQQALLLLRSYWLSHQWDEDALRPLMELLGEQERYQEAEAYYQQFLLAAVEQGLATKGQPHEPDPRTRDLREYLRTKQIQRQRIGAPTTNRAAQLATDERRISLQEPLTPPFSPTDGQNRTLSLEGIIEAVRELEGANHLNTSAAERRAILQQLLRFTGTIATSPVIAVGLPGLERLSYDPLQLFGSDEVTSEKLQAFATLTEICRHLSEGNELKTAEKILWSFLPRVESLVTHTLREPKTAASIVSQGYLLAASLVGHRNDLHARQYYSEQALLYGEIAQDDTLQVAAFRQLAATFNYLELPHKVMQTYQRALSHVDNVPPLLRSCIYAALSGVCAQFQQKQDAYRFIGLAYESFGEHQGDEPDFFSAINASQNLLIHWDGKNHLYLGQRHKAEKVFMRLDVLDPNMKLPKRIRVEAINNRARMFIAVGNMEQACVYLEAAAKLAVEIGSSLRLREVAATFQSLKSTWPDEKKVRASGDLFIQCLINHVC